MKYYIIAGEASGDLHASNLMKELKINASEDVEFRCWGGDLMESQGGTIVKHYRELAYMGFLEVLLNIKTILGNLKQCKSDIIKYKPDAIILVDYPGFNLRIADYFKSRNIPVLYYISPQVWAWKKSRIKKIKETVTKMFVILPFEKEFYHKHNMEVTFVGHPLIDAIEEFKRGKAITREQFISSNDLDSKPIISVLPGSRKQEISKKLPIMLKALEAFNEYQILIACAPSIDIEYYNSIINDNSNVRLIKDDTYNLLNLSHVSVVTSGTATLETALFNIPQVVCYKSSWLSYRIAKWLIKVKYISLVNLILNKESVKELIQNNLNDNNLRKEINNLLEESNRNSIFIDYLRLKELCGGEGASKITANQMLKTIPE